jgi:hypothetical protein
MTAVGAVPRLATTWDRSDVLGAMRVRCGFGRGDHRVEPGLYAVGAPDASSPVLVTANYKLSVDHLRRSMHGRSAWVLVVDTKGINGWCAAGKGTFSTDEVVRRVEAVRLIELLPGGTLILPQLAGPGVDAVAVARRTGLRVAWGPVRASDLPVFLDGALRAAPAARRVSFSLLDRAALLPMELRQILPRALVVAVILTLTAGLHPGGFSSVLMVTHGLVAALAWLSAVFVGTALVVLGLPWLPGRSFAFRGAAAGALLVALAALAGLRHPALTGSLSTVAAWCLVVPAAVSFTALLFTGATPLTSPSGVEREMGRALPVQAVASLLAAVLWLLGRVV